MKKSTSKVADKTPGNSILPTSVPQSSSKKSEPFDDDDFTLLEEVAEVTNWRLIYVTAAVHFLGAIEGALGHMSEWPYLQQLDPDATVQFYGIATSASKAAHAFFVLVFAIWSFKFKTIKYPLIVGRLIAIVACCLYMIVEFVPTGRRYIMMSCYILFDISESSSALIRAYIVAVSAPKDRSKAFAVMSFSMTLSIILAPLIQMAFTLIPYPGYTIIFQNVKFHVYSGPIWVSNFTNFISIGLIICGIKDLPKKEDVMKKKQRSIFEWEGLKMRIKKVKSSNISWILVFVIWIAKCGESLAIKSMSTLMSVLMMVQYGWTGTETVRITSILMAGSGLLSIFIIGNFMFCRLGTIVQPRFIYLVSITIVTMFFIITFPYKSIGEPAAVYNATEGTGCDPKKYTSCEGRIAPQSTLFICSLVVVFGLTMPASGISLDTIYSKVLGKIDQNVMQGAAVILDDVVQVFTPTYASYVYTILGLQPLWLINAIIMGFIVLLWIVMLRKFKSY
ncbi:unnamed protein product [Caenorhabditis sp. 36 PRJEB53466]|nr:unnamed protein product [Caenorhabditis sp. 36 PRJEB53466]